MVKTNSKPVDEEELKEESEIEEIIEKEEKSHRAKDGTGYGDLQALNVTPNDVNTDSETYIGKPSAKNNETYIGARHKSFRMNHTDMNKIQNTKVGDYINYYQNGVRDSGVVAKMSSSFVTIFKEDGTFHDVHINDTFYVSDILLNKTWNEMSLEERTDELFKVKAYSPRFLSKKWEDLPKELKDILKVNGFSQVSSDARMTRDRSPTPKTGRLPKDLEAHGTDSRKLQQAQSRGLDASHFTGNTPNKIGDAKHIPLSESEGYVYNTEEDAKRQYHSGSKRLPNTGNAPKDIKRSDVEHQTHGSVAGSPSAGVSTDISFDASNDYEGATHEKRDEQFKHEHKKPKVDKDGVKKMGEFTYSEKPNYKVKGVPEQTTSTWRMRYGVKFINKEDKEE